MATLWQSFRGLFAGGAGTRTPGQQTGEAGSQPSAPAANVNQDTALCHSAFWAAVMLYAETTGSLPVVFYEVDGKGTETELRNYALAKLLNGKPNRYQTAAEFWQTVGAQLRMHGNVACLIQRQGDKPDGEIIGLLPLMWSQVEVELLPNGDVQYRYNSGTTQRILSADKIWHVKGPGNGIIGMSPLSYARNTVGVGLAANNRMGKIFGNGAKPAGVLTTDVVLKDDQRAKVKQNFREMTEGNEDTLFVLEAGFAYQQISMLPKDIELLDSARFSVEEIARYMGAPSVLINDGSAQTAWGTGIGQIVRGWYQVKLRPFLKLIESSVGVYLVPVGDRGRVIMRFYLDELLLVELEARMRAYKEAVTGGIMTPNEARADEGLKPLPGGDEIYMQQQMVPLRLLATGAGLKSNSGGGNEPSQTS